MALFKNFVKSSYDNFHTELQKMRSSSAVTGNLRYFVVQVQTLVLCRIKLIEYYAHVHAQSQAESKRIFNFKGYDDTLTEIIK